jgi:hypothetical protein
MRVSPQRAVPDQPGTDGQRAGDQAFLVAARQHRAGIEAAGGGQLFRGECEKVTVLVAASNAVHPVAVTARMGLVGPSLVSRTPSSRDRGGDLDASNDELVDALVRRIRAQRAPSDDDH